jgi:hypothetical protein
MALLDDDRTLVVADSYASAPIGYDIHSDRSLSDRWV